MAAQVVGWLAAGDCSHTQLTALLSPQTPAAALDAALAEARFAPVPSRLFLSRFYPASLIHP